MNIRETILMIVKDSFAGSKCRVAKVLAVDGSTCSVETLDTQTEMTDVRLQAAEASGILMVPVVDSFVIIAPFDDFEYVVVMYSAIESIKFLDGSYGGLTKTPELKTQLDKTNEVVQAIVDSLKNWTPVSSDGGAALKAFSNSTLGSKEVGDYTNIENEKVTHGNV